MASVEKRKSGWIGRYRVDGVRKSTRVFKRKTDAREEAQRLEERGKKGDWIDPKAGHATVGDWFGTWQKMRSVKANTINTDQERFDSLIAPRFGKVPLRQVTYAAVREWSHTMVAPRTGEVAGAQRRRDATNLLVRVLDAAVNADLIPANRARSKTGKVDFLPRASTAKAHRYLSFEELQRLADAMASDEGATLVLLAGMTGLRWGELSALTVADVNLLRQPNRVSVNKAWSRAGKGVVISSTKTYATREVPIASMLADRLAAAMAGKRAGDLLFAGAVGQPLRRESFARNQFEPAVQRAGRAVSDLQRLLGIEPVLVSGLYDARTGDLVAEVQRAAGMAVTGECGPGTWSLLAQREDRSAMSQGEKVSRTRWFKARSRMTLRPGAADFERLTPHDLRHTAASLAIAKGMNVKTVQRMLGHESAKMTLDTYAGLFESDFDRLADAMAEGMESARGHYVDTGGLRTLGEVVPLAQLSR